MRFFVGVTDYDWFRFLAARPEIDEVNFWQPSGGVEFKALRPGDLFLFDPIARGTTSRGVGSSRPGAVSR